MIALPFAIVSTCQRRVKSSGRVAGHTRRDWRVARARHVLFAAEDVAVPAGQRAKVASIPKVRGQRRVGPQATLKRFPSRQTIGQVLTVGVGLVP